MMSFFRTLTTTERRVLGWGTAGALVLSLAPYVFGWLVAGRDFVYLWVNPLGSADTNVYFSFLRQVMDGRVFLENLHTGEVQHGAIFHPLWLALGWLGGVFRLSPAAVFHGSRLLIGGVFLVAVYRFLMHVFSDPRRRMIAFLLTAFSSGVGIFSSLGVSQSNPTEMLLLLPSDQWISESNTFLTLLHSPLFLLSQLLLLVVWTQLLDVQRKRETRLVVVAVVLLAMIHPYDLVTVAAVVPLFLALRLLTDPAFSRTDFWRAVRSFALAGAAALAPIAALAVATRLEPALGGWAKQNITTSPPLHSYLFGYGFLLLFAVPGLVALRRRITPARLLVIIWTLASIVLLYVPFQSNRRMSNGLHLALAILAAVGVDRCWQAIAARLPRRGPYRDVVFAVVGWVVGFGLFFGTAATVAKAMYWSRIPSTSIYHLPRTVADGIDWLKDHTDAAAVILAHSYHGNIIPARTVRRVFIGHGHQTINWEEKRTLATTWFWRTNRDDDAKHRFLVENRVSHLFFSEFEDRMGEYDPAAKPYLTPVYRNADVTIYRVLATAPVR